ncbi:Membrane-bound lytic murein transglycosylase B [Micromonospora purpureochromogenes]|uniref:Membrane-bound lytic murein transglycosylase B n=1 Tax=Micromonospora purpureochromogenes TaxID=47872 RepID=A0A1C4VJS6_9ACTN|nr:Membrane-bound lytic murein transglycosylase B [Micromonospora purpureochromogenes]
MRPLRPATPPDGPLASSGAAPDPTPVPRPRRPFLDPSPAEPSTATTAGSAPTTVESNDGGAAQVRPGTPGRAKADAGTTDATEAGRENVDVGKADAEKAGAEKAGAEKAGAEKAGGGAADTSKAGAGRTDAETGDGSRAGEEAGATPTDGLEKDSARADAKAGGEPGRRRRMPFAHAVRLPPPRQAVVGAARATRAWSLRPSGRLTLPGVFLVALVAATAVVGAVVVPSAARSPKPVAVDATEGAVVVPAPGALPGATAVPVLPGGTALPGLPPATALPGGVPPTGPVAPPATGRPADTLAAWAQTTGARVGISPVAMQAYGYAELVLAETNRSCQLSWTTLAAIGYVESRHGQANGASLQSTGRAEPEIIGDPLDGQGGRSRITDTDRGLFDRDTVYDRAIGPMQFIPTTWQEIGVDADNDGRKDPHDLDDAALAAARYVCKGGRNMTIPGDWWGAILSYNDVRRYAQDVFDKANQYGVASRT